MMGKQARLLFGLDEDAFGETPIDEVRANLNIVNHIVDVRAN
jgi:ubiquinone biosynthesis protein Coq4